MTLLHEKHCRAISKRVKPSLTSNPRRISKISCNLTLIGLVFTALLIHIAFVHSFGVYESDSSEKQNNHNPPLSIKNRNKAFLGGSTDKRRNQNVSTTPKTSESIKKKKYLAEKDTKMDNEKNPVTEASITHDEVTLNLAKKESAEHIQGLSELYDIMRRKKMIIKAYAMDDESIDVNGAENVKVVHFLRHGQGFHNLMADLAHAAGREWTQFVNSPDNPYVMPEISDSPLTQKGRDQARAVQSQLKDMQTLPQMIVLSSNCRALQTGIIAFEPLLQDEKVPFIAHEMVREETGVHVCDKRRPKSQQESEFPMVDFSLIETEQDELFSPTERESKMAVGERIYTFMEWLSQRSEKHVGVTSHSGWLFTVFNAICECDDTLKGWFHTGELRSVKLVFTVNNL